MSESTKPVDLLSGDSNEAAAADPTKFSIDDNEDYNKLEGNYSDDDDDVSVEDDDQADGHISALASRTNHLINSYRDYIAEMNSDPVVLDSDVDAAAAVIVMESGKTAADENNFGEEAAATWTTLPGAKGFSGQFQDVRKGATLSRDFSYRDDPTHQNNNVNPREPRFGNDHSFATYNAEFEHSGKSRKGYHYTIRSAGFRRCAVGIVALGAIIGISVGIAKTQQRKKDLPDWEGMLAEEEQGESSQSGTVGPYQPILQQEPNNPLNSQEILELYQHSAMEYHPLWFSREQGWNGQTYDAAMSYCAGQMGVLIVCSYDAICPAGPNMMPVGGKKTGAEPNESTWVPFIDEENAWAQVGISESFCEKHDGAPKWGVTGEGNEGVTRFVACCRARTNDGTATVVTNNPSSIAEDANANVSTLDALASGEAQQAQFNWAAEAYDPELFDRNKGWLGTNYDEAVGFCRHHNKTICPFEAYCPMTKAPGSVPFGGVKAEYSWAPIDDAKNWWVQVSGTDTCQLYNEMNGGPPEWGMGGKNELETRFLMCCKQPGAEAGAADYYHSSMSDGTEPYTEVVIDKDECQDHPTALIDAEGKHTCENYISHVGRVPLHNARCSHESPLKNEYGETLLVREVCRLSCGECGNVWEEPVAATAERPIVTTAEEPVVTTADEPVVTTVTTSAKEPVAGELGLKYSSAEQTYKPIWYSRASGWNGRTYQESLNFCEAQGQNMMLCPILALCPDGVGQLPYPGTQVLERESWTAFVDKANGWVHVGSGSSALDCVPYENMHPNTPDWGETGLDNEEITRHILCCSELGVEAQVPSQPEVPQPSQTVAATDANLSVEEYDLLVETGSKFRVKRFDRDSGWGGSSYYEALTFCGRKGAIICPYESYCPQGPSKAVVGGMAATPQWVPFINIANGWIQIGPDDTCMPYNSLNSFPPEWGLTGENKAETSNIMCCEPDDNWIPEDQSANVVVSSAPSLIDKIAMDMFKPIWFGRKHGWQGGSFQDAVKFCNNIGDMDLCPIMALCPDGKTLFNDIPPFRGEQWSPLSDGDWALTGLTESDPSATCQQYHVLTEQPSTNIDRESADKKQHVMCCAKSKQGTDQEDLEEVIKVTMQPTWYDSSGGWNGNSHSDAVDFCQKNGGKHLCPYVAYCPNGEGSQPFPGHPVDFNTETIMQWSPWNEDTGKGWVLVSRKYQNSATTCMTYSELEGGIPSWDESSNLAEAKKYILCCSVPDIHG